MVYLTECCAAARPTAPCAAHAQINNWQWKPSGGVKHRHQTLAHVLRLCKQQRLTA